MVIDRALRDEGTKYHYLPASDYSEADAHLARLARSALMEGGLSVQVGSAWTTDAPFRETQEAVEAAAKAGILAVEMKLPRFTRSRRRASAGIWIAHVTNQMGRVQRDFEKGASVDGAEELLKVISLIGRRWRAECP